MLFPRLNPPKIGPFTLIALSFASVILLGTVLLYLPVARNVQDVQITLIDAFFTATSAVCVTGLTVVDTGGYFSRFGQTVILGLVQVGGLGLMTLAGFFWTIMGEKMSLFNRFTTQNAVSDLSAKGTGRFISSIIISTLVIELFGAGLLFIRFAGEMPIGDAVYTSIFHAISAFCNAGFGLFSDSLMKYRGDWLINWTVMSLIFLGGIGFTVLVNVTRFLRTKDRHITMHSKLVLITSGLLIVFGAIIFFILENDNIYKNMGINETFLSSIFTSVTARTAGFNTIDYGLAKDASLLFLCVLMFIGASPGSTGGGIKTTTFTILIFTILNTLRERQAVTFMEREVTLVTVRKALTIFFLSFSWVMLVIVLVSSIENTKFPLSHVIFETISAFGTVGLSAGITAKLTDMSKIIITLTMFFGRIGPLGLVLALGIMAKKTQIQYPDEKILIG
ncbi:MAG: hypothetical protein A2Y33_00020 [Spirochaetes bacterium GWF1_51_8]|nr:MAG: hypothetical protein A2Y33_00020 [Spirochaetes bacterium GWF1_51_8]